MIMYSWWLSTPLSTRHKIAEQFKIVKKGATEVFNNTIKSDGYVLKDIETAITVESMQAYTGSDSKDTHVLWGLTIDKVEGKPRVMKNTDVEGPMSVLPKEEAAQFNKEYEERNPGKTAPVAGAEEEKPKQRGRPKKIINETKE